MGYKVTNPIMCTEREANDVIRNMQQRIDERGYVTLEEVYNMVGMLGELRGHKDYAYGWEKLRVADVKPNTYYGGYEVRLPEPIAL